MAAPTFTVKGTFKQLTGGTQAPMARARILFVPNFSSDTMIEVDGSVESIEPVSVTLDVDGKINGSTGIPLLANDDSLGLGADLQWTVMPVANSPFKFKKWTFTAAAAGATLDLKDAIPEQAVHALAAAGSIAWNAVNDVPLLAPVESFYRPLEGYRTDITSVIDAGTVTTGVGSTIGWADAAGKYRFCGMNPEAATDSNYCINNNAGLSDSFIFQPTVIEFMSNATKVNTFMACFSKPDVWVLVDNQRITQGFQHANQTDGDMTWKLSQADPAWHHYRICFIGLFRGIAINAGATIIPTTPGLQVAIIGDSYVQGNILTANAVSSGVSGAISAGAIYGEWEQESGVDCWRFGVSGSGGVATAGLTGGNYGSATRLAKFASRSASFDLLIFNGTVNDYASPAATVAAAHEAAWTAYHAAKPAPIIVVGPEGGIPGTPNDNINTAMKAKAAAHPHVSAYIDVRTKSFLTGTGHDGGAAGDGNRDVYMGADGDANIHLTHLGARAGARHLRPRIGQVTLERSR